MANTSDEKLDLKDSKLLLDGDPKDHEEWADKIKSRADYLAGDRDERKQVYQIRRDFYVGNHGKYTNIVGLIQKEKKGHANAVINYAGKTAAKIAYSLTNNPPNVTYPVDPNYKPTNPNYDQEEVRTQGVEDFTDEVFRRNKFWKRGYRRGVFNQVVLGDFAIKVYPLNVGTPEEPAWEFKIVAQEKMENILVGWRGDDAKDYDYVICEEEKTIQSVYEDWGIRVPVGMSTKPDGWDKTGIQKSNHNQNQWGTRNTGLGGRAILPSGKNAIPTVKVREYDDENHYIIMIEDEVVQFVVKDDVTYPKMKFYILGENIPCPGSPWSVSDIDYLVDANIELNEASNEERDYIRVGANTKYVAYNMTDFDPESIKTGSGGVIFIDSVDNSARFEPLASNVNTYPADQFLARQKKHLHDLGVPEVSFGSATGNSGRSKAIDYQSMVDLTIFKRDSWELVLTELSEKIQALGFFYFKHDFFTDAQTGEFKFRYPEFDWSDIVPITESDKIVNILNKVQMGLPFSLAFKELGYRDVDAVINMIKKEAQDPILMEYRAKMYQLTPGIQSASQQQLAAQAEQTPTPDNMGGGMDANMGANMGADVNAQAAGPTLTSSQSDTKLPVSTAGGTTSYSSGAGLIKRMGQNLQAQGR